MNAPVSVCELEITSDSWSFEFGMKREICFIFPGLQVRPEDSSLKKIQDTSVKKNIVRYSFTLFSNLPRTYKDFIIILQLPLKDTITISIVTMNLFEKTTLMNDPDVHVLYIEYSFLGMRGADMETVSISKPKNKSEPMVYNFTRCKIFG